MEHVSNRSTLRGNVVYTDHYVSTFLRRYFHRRYSFPYDESKGIDARNIIGGGEETTMFLHALPYHVENFASYQDLTSWLHPISSISMPVFLPLSNPIPRISQPVCGGKIYFLRESLHARPIKTRCIFSWSNGSFPRRARLTRPSENPWITPVESSRVWGPTRLNERRGLP